MSKVTHWHCKTCGDLGWGTHDPKDEINAHVQRGHVVLSWTTGVKGITTTHRLEVER